MSSEEAARYAGVTLRQLQFWDENGIVEPDRCKNARVYSERQALELRVLAEFRRKGVSLQKLRPLIPDIRRRLKQAKPGMYIGLHGPYVALFLNGSAFEMLMKEATMRIPLVVARV